jgi:hypothetical protein
MQEKGKQILLICLKFFSLAALLLIFYAGMVKLLYVPLLDWAYYPTHKIHTLKALIIVLSFDFVWLLLMKMCPKDKMHIKTVLTLLILVFSAAILTCFVLAHATEHAF